MTRDRGSIGSILLGGKRIFLQHFDFTLKVIVWVAMVQIVALLSLLVPAVAFTTTSSKPAMSALTEKSASLPFLERPAKVNYTRDIRLS